MKRRGNHDAGFKARVAPEALQGEPVLSEPAAGCGMHPTMMHLWRAPFCALGSTAMARGPMGRRG